MKHNLIIFLVLVVFGTFAGCNTSQKFAKKTQTQTEISEQNTTLINSDLQTAAHAIGVSDVDIEIDENEVIIELSAPDSAGTQYPTKITLKGKKIGLSARNRQENSVESSAQTDVETRRATSLQSETAAETHTVTKHLLSFGGYIRLFVVGILVAIAIFIYIKFKL
jgi:hypothetical protein